MSHKDAHIKKHQATNDTFFYGCLDFNIVGITREQPFKPARIILIKCLSLTFYSCNDVF